jgi:hypothetical protein
VTGCAAYALEYILALSQKRVARLAPLRRRPEIRHEEQQQLGIFQRHLRIREIILVLSRPERALVLVSERDTHLARCGRPQELGQRGDIGFPAEASDTSVGRRRCPPADTIVVVVIRVGVRDDGLLWDLVDEAKPKRAGVCRCS